MCVCLYVVLVAVGNRFGVACNYRYLRDLCVIELHSSFWTWECKACTPSPEQGKDIKEDGGCRSGRKGHVGQGSRTFLSCL